MDFYKRVALVCAQIPRGKVATYGQIALLCGCPRQSRRVGYALGHGLAGKQPPAHRVVNHAGYLSGAPSFETPDTQREMLRSEGVEVSLEEGKQRVSLKRYGWKNTLEEALHLEQMFKEQVI